VATYRSLAANADSALDDVMKLAVENVRSWNFTDEETAQPLEVGVDVLDELSVDQFRFLFSAFNQKLGVKGIGLAEDMSDADKAAVAGQEPEGEVPNPNA
jgi:hypothetical protein